jgi:dual-specificity kinase
MGSILIEFYTGTALFQTHDNLEHLTMTEAVMGPTSPSREKQQGEYFNEMTNKLDRPPHGKKVTSMGGGEVRATRSLVVSFRF